jgi:hypothetical protein
VCSVPLALPALRVADTWASIPSDWALPLSVWVGGEAHALEHSNKPDAATSARHANALETRAAMRLLGKLFTTNHHPLCCWNTTTG